MEEHSLEEFVKNLSETLSRSNDFALAMFPVVISLEWANKFSEYVINKVVPKLVSSLGDT